MQALGAKGSQYVAKAPAGKRLASKALGRYLARPRRGPASATRTYATNALVLLVEFGDAAWPEGDSTGHVLAGPEHGAIAAARARTTTSRSGRATSRPCTTSRCSSATRTRSTTRTARAAAPATTRCATTTSSSRTARTPSHGDIADWVKLDLPESWYGADSDPWNWTDDLTGPVWRVARDAIVKFASENPGFDWAQYDQENPWGIVAGGLLRSPTATSTT